MLLVYWFIFIVIITIGIWKIANLDISIPGKWILGTIFFVLYSIILLAIGALFEKGGILVLREIKLILPILTIIFSPVIVYMSWERLKKYKAEKAVLFVSALAWVVSYIWIAFIGVASSLQFP